MPDLVASVTSAHRGEGEKDEATELGIKRTRASVVPGVGLGLLLLRTNLRSATNRAALHIAGRLDRTGGRTQAPRERSQRCLRVVLL